MADGRAASRRSVSDLIRHAPCHRLTRKHLHAPSITSLRQFVTSATRQHSQLLWNPKGTADTNASPQSQSAQYISARGVREWVFNSNSLPFPCTNSNSRPAPVAAYSSLYSRWLSTSNSRSLPWKFPHLITRGSYDSLNQIRYAHSDAMSPF